MKSAIDFFIGSWTDQDLRDRSDSLPGYRSLVLFGSAISDEGLAELTRCEKLRELHLVETRITNDGLKSLARLKSLDWLVIDGADVDDQGIRHLGDLRRLNGLQLLETRARDDGMSVLFHFPKLTYLESAGHNMGSKGLSLIANLPSLTYLRLASPVVTDNDFLNLVVSCSLRSLSVDLPLVSPGALEEVTERLPQCKLTRFQYSRMEGKSLWLPSYCIDLYGRQEFELARDVADDALKVFPFNQAVHGARALINLKLGNFYQYRKDLENARDMALLHCDQELSTTIQRYLSLASSRSVRDALASNDLEELVRERVSRQIPDRGKKREPIQLIMQRLMSVENVSKKPRQVFPTQQQALMRLEEVRKSDPANEIFYDLARFRRAKKDLLTVPWSW